MNIQAEKSEIIERFRQIDDISLINTIKSILDYAQKVHNRELDEALKIKLSNRALESEKNIKNNETFNLDEMKLKTAQLLR